MIDSKKLKKKRDMRCFGKPCFGEKVRGKVWKDYLEGIMNEVKDWDYSVEGDVAEGPVVCVSREKVLLALDEMKTGKASEPSE